MQHISSHLKRAGHRLPSTIACVGSFLAIAALTPTVTALDFDDDVTPEVIFGSGNINGAFTTDRTADVEVGLRAKLRFDDNNMPDNIFNSNGDGTYTFKAAVAPGGFGFQPIPPNDPTTPIWSFEWSVNTDFDNTGAFPALDDLSYALMIDMDPSAGTDFITFDPITGINPANGMILWDHAMGTNATPNGGGTSSGTASAYATALGANNVAQNSWSYEFFNEAPYDDFDPTVAGEYEISMKVFDGVTEIADATITVNVVIGTDLVVSTPDDWCTKDVGDTVTVDITMENADQPVAGGEYLIAYNADVLSFVSSVAGVAPFDMKIFELTDPFATNNGSGTDYLFLSTGNFVTPGSTTADSLLASLTFMLNSETCSTAGLVVLDPGAQPLGTYLTNSLGLEVPHVATNLSSQTVDDTPPVIAALSPISVNADAGVCDAVVTFVAPVVTDNCSAGYCAYLQDFEAGGLGGDDWNAFNSAVSIVASGSGTIGAASSAGASHAEIDALTDPQTGAFTRLGGYSSSWGDGFITSVDVYIDLSDPAVAADTYGWDLSSAANDQAGSHRRDFIFHTASNAAGEVLVGGSNNSNFTRRNDLATINHYAIDATGWYTFESVFRDAGDGTLAVDLNLRDSAGTLLWTETRNDASDVIATEVGGNRYMWFTFLEVDTLAIDENKLTRGVAAGDPLTVDVSPPSGSVFPGGVTTVTVTATDVCGNQTVDTFDVTVSGDNEAIIDLAYDGSLDAMVDRCIEFVFEGTSGTQIVNQVVTFDAAGTATGVSVLVPCGDYDCLTARDPLHTLASSVDLTLSGTEYAASVTGTESMIGGNFNGDTFIDVLDFGVFVGQFGSSLPVNTNCGTAPPHADITGDGTVAGGDFSFIQINFLEIGDAGCTLGPVHGTPAFSKRSRRAEIWTGPVTRISIEELEHRGLTELAVADLNDDKWIDQLDIVAWLQGVRP